MSISLDQKERMAIVLAVNGKVSELLDKHNEQERVMSELLTLVQQHADIYQRLADEAGAENERLLKQLEKL